MVFCECLFGLYADIGCMAVFRRQIANQFVLRTVREGERDAFLHGEILRRLQSAL